MVLLAVPMLKTGAELKFSNGACGAKAIATDSLNSEVCPVIEGSPKKFVICVAVADT